MRITRTVHAGPCPSACDSRCRRRCSRAADESLGRRLHTVGSFSPFAGDARTRHSRTNRSACRCRSCLDPAGAADGRSDHNGDRGNSRLRRAGDPRRAAGTADARGSAAGSSGERSRILSIRRSIGDITVVDAAIDTSTGCVPTASGHRSHNGTSGERCRTGRPGSCGHRAGRRSGPASEPGARRGAAAGRHDSHDSHGPGRHPDRAAGHDDAAGHHGPVAARTAATGTGRTHHPLRAAVGGAVSNRQYH
jgi:hypothetical protein